jgi:ParB family chromosome partitioning protein
VAGAFPPPADRKERKKYGRRKCNQGWISLPAEGEELVGRKLYDVPLDYLSTDPDQPRKYFDDEAMVELENSIKKHGVLQPLLFRRAEDGQLFIVSGERRYRASQSAGQQTIPAIYNDGKNNAEIALVENLLRENLNPVEEAEALKKLKDDESYTHEELSTVIGKAVSTISEILSLNKLPAEIKDECREDAKYSRRTLVEIAKADTSEAMTALFEKYKKMELKSDGVRAAAREQASPSEAMKKKVESFRKQVDKIDFEKFGDDRGSVESALRYLMEAIRAKLPVAS